MKSTSNKRYGITERTTIMMIAIAAGVVFTLAAASCSTTEGFGEDIKNLGGGIEDSAARNK